MEYSLCTKLMDIVTARKENIKRFNRDQCDNLYSLQREIRIAIFNLTHFSIRTN